MVGVKRDIKNKNIETLGYMDEKSLKNLYAKAKYFIFPSLYEGFGFPAIEAMRCRCGVVVSNISSLPEICKDGVLYINPNDTNDIINKVKLISSDNKLYKHLTNKAYNISKNYSWDSAFKKYMEVIDESSNNS
jgi:glycosyltransferase involved in cell wall biosynthesis